MICGERRSPFGGLLALVKFIDTHSSRRSSRDFIRRRAPARHELQESEHFVLVNDHDPKPLYYSFLHEREGLFEWEYLEQGPDRWRVRITKKAGLKKAV